MKATLSQNWQQILSCVHALQTTYAIIDRASDDGIALYGAGSTGLEAVKYFRNKNVKIRCFIDGSTLKQGTSLAGIPVVSCDHPLAKTTPLVLITTRCSIGTIRRQLQADGHACMSFPAFYVVANLSRYEAVRDDILADDMSRVCLDALLLAMLTGRLGYCADVMNETPYFCLSHFQNIGEEFFVDAGAYVGDTTEKFIWSSTGLFQHVHLFEPGVLQFKALQTRMKRLIEEWALDPNKISMMNVGLGEHNGRACFGTSTDKLAATALLEDTAHSDIGIPYVDVCSLDSYLEQNQFPVSFIKADIEGMEVQMLRGACAALKKYKPKLAISVYHNLSDLFDVITIVRSCVPEYTFSLRHHSSNLSETVLYCWVDVNGL